MVKLYEKLTIDQVAELVPEVRNALLELGSHGEDRGVTGGSQYMMPRQWGRTQEVSYPILRYVHSTMMRQAQPGSLPHPYTHTWFGHIAPVIRQLSDELLTEDQIGKLSTQVLGILEGNQLAKRMGKGATAAFMVAPWPPGFEPRIYSYHELRSKQSHKDVVVMEKRIKEENDKPVETHFDLSAIPLPGPDPESILNYVAKLKQCFDRLNAKYELAQEELAQLKERAEWGDIPKRIGEILRE